MHSSKKSVTFVWDSNPCHQRYMAGILSTRRTKQEIIKKVVNYSASLYLLRLPFRLITPVRI